MLCSVGREPGDPVLLVWVCVASGRSLSSLERFFFFFGDIQFVSNHGLASVMFLRLGGSHGGNGRHLALLERFGSGRGSWPGGEWLVGGGGAPGRGKSVGQDREAGKCRVSLENSQSFVQSEGGRQEGRFHRSAGASAAVLGRSFEDDRKPVKGWKSLSYICF